MTVPFKTVSRKASGLPTGHGQNQPVEEGKKVKDTEDRQDMSIDLCHQLALCGGREPRHVVSGRYARP